MQTKPGLRIRVFFGININMQNPNTLKNVGRQKNVLSDGTTGFEILKNYRHASKIFIDSSYRLSPKYGFLFYVEFDFNPMITNISGKSAQEMGMIVKSVNLPKFTMEVKEHNAYNRKNFVQNRIKYDPVNITFHDDQDDLIRNFWYDYYSYYYRDPDYSDVTYGAPHKYHLRPQQNWGYTPRTNTGYDGIDSNQQYQYIQAIRIYSLYQHNFSECALINPIITSFRHGEHVNGESALMGHEMSIQFETVKYLTGFTTSDTAGGFIDLHYDTEPSPLTLSDASPGPNSNLSAITDLADSEASLVAAARVQTLNGGSSTGTGTNINFPNSPSVASAVAYQLASQSAGSSAGGFSIPGFGTRSSAMALTGAGTNTAFGPGMSTAAAQAATGNSGFGVGFPATLYAQTGAQFQVTGVSGLVNGLQAQTIGQLKNTALSTLGPSPINLAAVLNNPSKAIQTVKNMAVGYAVSYVNQQVGSLVQSGLNSAKSSIANSLGVASGDLSIQGALNSIKSSYASLTASPPPELLANDFAQQQLDIANLNNVSAEQFPGSVINSDVSSYANEFSDASVQSVSDVFGSAAASSDVAGIAPAFDAGSFF